MPVLLSPPAEAHESRTFSVTSGDLLTLDIPVVRLD